MKRPSELDPAALGFTCSECRGQWRARWGGDRGPRRNWTESWCSACRGKEECRAGRSSSARRSHWRRRGRSRPSPRSCETWCAVCRLGRSRWKRAEPPLRSSSAERTSSEQSWIFATTRSPAIDWATEARAPACLPEVWFRAHHLQASFADW